MKLYMTLVFAICLSSFFAERPLAKELDINLKDGHWLAPVDGRQYIDIKGTAKGSAAGTSVVLSLRGKTLRTKVDKEGNFSFKFDQLNIPAYSESKLVVRTDGEKTKPISIRLYCCSPEGFGEFSHLEPTKDYELTIDNKDSLILGASIKIPDGLLKKPGTASVTLQANFIIPDKYAAIGPGVEFYVSGDETYKGMKMELPINWEKPRDNMAMVTNNERFELIHGHQWDIVKTLKDDVFILAHDIYFQWTKLKVAKINPNSVILETDERTIYRAFVPVVEMPSKPGKESSL